MTSLRSQRRKSVGGQVESKRLRKEREEELEAATAQQEWKRQEVDVLKKQIQALTISLNVKAAETFSLRWYRQVFYAWRTLTLWTISAEQTKFFYKDADAKALKFTAQLAKGLEKKGGPEVVLREVWVSWRGASHARSLMRRASGNEVENEKLREKLREVRVKNHALAEEEQESGRKAADVQRELDETVAKSAAAVVTLEGPLVNREEAAVAWAEATSRLQWLRVEAEESQGAVDEYWERAKAFRVASTDDREEVDFQAVTMALAKAALPQARLCSVEAALTALAHATSAHLSEAWLALSAAGVPMPADVLAGRAPLWPHHRMANAANSATKLQPLTELKISAQVDLERLMAALAIVRAGVTRQRGTAGNPQSPPA